MYIHQFSFNYLDSYGYEILQRSILCFPKCFITVVTQIGISFEKLLEV